MDNSIFKLIKSAEEKTKLWDDLAKARGEILCKGKEDVLCKLKAQYYNAKNNYVECSYETPDRLFPAEDYLGYFFIGGEKYYFRSVEKLQNDKVLIPLAENLYRLQRRQNYRVRIPENYHAYYNIVSVNGRAQNLVGRLGDLSSQGCRTVYPENTHALKEEDKVIGHLIIGKRAPIEIEGIVRHLKPEGKLQNCGIEFSPLTSIMENKLFMITMEIHKEIFRR
ncbi:MAG: PilZ domain-containing protein [Bdellovibrio sp.]